MIKRNLLYLTVLFVFIIIVLFFISIDVLRVYDVTSGRVLMDVPLLDDRFSLWYIHSIQLTPNYENFVVKDGKMILYETVYETVGVGLPSVNEGSFYMDNGRMIMKLHREYEEILLRIYTKPDNSLIVRDKRFRLMDYANSEDLIRLSVHKGFNPLYLLWRKAGL